MCCWVGCSTGGEAQALPLPCHTWATARCCQPGGTRAVLSPALPPPTWHAALFSRPLKVLPRLGMPAVPTRASASCRGGAGSRVLQGRPAAAVGQWAPLPTGLAHRRPCSLPHAVPGCPPPPQAPSQPTDQQAARQRAQQAHHAQVSVLNRHLVQRGAAGAHERPQLVGVRHPRLLLPTLHHGCGQLNLVRAAAARGAVHGSRVGEGGRGCTPGRGAAQGLGHQGAQLAGRHPAQQEHSAEQRALPPPARGALTLPSCCLAGARGGAPGAPPPPAPPCRTGR